MKARAICVLFLFLQACGSTTIEFPNMQPTVDVTGPDSSVDVAATLAALDRHFDSRGERAMPLPSDRIDALERELPCPLGPQLRAMYAWRNGIEAFVPGYDWLPLDQAVEEAKQLRSYADEMPDDGWLRTHWPLMMLDGKEYLLIDCGSGKPTTIVRYFVENGSRSVRYRGVGHWLATTLAAYDNGGYRYRRDYLETSPILVRQAFDRYALDSERQAAEANWQRLEPALRRAEGVQLPLLLERAQALGDARSIPILIERLQTANADVSAFAAHTLGELRAAQALPNLEAMLGHNAPQVRNLAALSIGKLDATLPPSTIDKLLALLDDPNDLVKLSAIETLGASRSPRALEPLLQRLTKSRSGIQFAIVDALVELRDKSALPALRQLHADLAGADMSARSKGGMRGADVTPRQLKDAVERAIADLDS